MAKKTAPEDNYDAGSIKQLKGLEAVRSRTGMYLGSPVDGNALHHCIKEVVDNSVDEHLAGHCTKVHVELLPDGYCRVSDNGRGIPVGPHPTEKIDSLQLVMCSLHSGGKFDRDSYKEGSAGLHGVGVAAVNAVSSYCRAVVHRGGKVWEQTYSRGIPTSEVVQTGTTDMRGTTIEWQRDLEIFSGVIEYDRKLVAERLQELAFLNPGLTIILADVRDDKPFEKTYVYEGGLREYLADMIGKKKGTLPIIYFESTNRNVKVALTWVDRDGEDVRCYANNTFNRDGGPHLTGFRAGLTRLVTNYAKEHGLTKGLTEEGITSNDVRDGLLAVVAVQLPNVQFSSQTKDKLVTPEARGLVEDILMDRLLHYFEANPGTARKIAERAVVSAKAREAAKKARDAVKRKEFMDPLSLPGKLADCQSKYPEECELFVVEGDSAGGSSKNARDRKFQAILPLRGKVLNVERVTNVEAILENKEIGTIITALGCGIEQTSSFDLSKLRYHKIILMADADVDGSHIRTLLLTMFYRCMPRLIYYGHVYIAMPPLYGARLSGAKNDMFFTGEAELEAFKQNLTEEQARRLRITRYKGLGEMDAPALWATTLDPMERTLKQVTIQDAIEAEKLFDLFMGENVEPRRVYIEEHGIEATNLDL